MTIDRGHTDVNPVQNNGSHSQSEVRSLVLSEAELVTIWKACGDDDYGWIARLLILTGQRKMELGGLERAA